MLFIIAGKNSRNRTKLKAHLMSKGKRYTIVKNWCRWYLVKGRVFFFDEDTYAVVLKKNKHKYWFDFGRNNLEGALHDFCFRLRYESGVNLHERLGMDCAVCGRGYCCPEHPDHEIMYNELLEEKRH